MQGLAQRQSQQRDSRLLVPARQNRSNSRPASMTNMFPINQQPMSNQAAQRFAESCPLTLPSPGRCPYGGICHTCPPKVQAKLKISQPGDKYEQEADRIAEQVMRMPDPDSLQKKEIIGETQLSGNQRSIVSQTSAPSHLPSIVKEMMNSSGRPLDITARAYFEPRFGYDLSRVRVYGDSQASDSARMLKAVAYTVGKNIVLRDGYGVLSSYFGKRLLAHELTHVIQQGSKHENNQNKFSNGNAIHKFNRNNLVNNISLTNNNCSFSPLVQRACSYFPHHSDPDTYCETRAEAEALPNMACPPDSNDFLYRDGPATHRWRPIPGLGGCAHWVAHRLIIREGRWYENCLRGYSVTRDQITHGRTSHPLTAANEGDIWRGATHSGVVRAVDQANARVLIEQCGNANVVSSCWEYSGRVYR